MSYASDELDELDEPYVADESDVVHDDALVEIVLLRFKFTIDGGIILS